MQSGSNNGSHGENPGKEEPATGSGAAFLIPRSIGEHKRQDGVGRVARQREHYYIMHLTCQNVFFPQGIAVAFCQFSASITIKRTCSMSNWRSFRAGAIDLQTKMLTNVNGGDNCLLGRLTVFETGRAGKGRGFLARNSSRNRQKVKKGPPDCR